MKKFKLTGPFSCLLTMDDLPARGPISDDRLQVIHQAGILSSNGIIEAVGPYRELKNLAAENEITEGELTAMPGMIDVHTHICWAGSRANDYAMRLSGKNYLEIARSGGGIWSTVSKTREARADDLIKITASRSEKMLQQGITTLEVKSGYGLSKDAELKMLQAIHAADEISAADIIPTCLAAHIKPKDFEGSPRQYLEYIINDLLPAVKSGNLASRVDIYIDEGAFSVDDGRFYLSAAKKLGFDIAVHADQFFVGGLQLAVEFDAESADHLEATTEDDIRLVARSKVIPVALPGASIGLGARFAPARRLLDEGASLVIASDWNPGSAPMGKLLLQAAVLGMYEKLTMAETLAALTCRAAPALRLADRGVLKPGMMADFIAFPCSDYRDILYTQGAMMPVGVWKRGVKR